MKVPSVISEYMATIGSRGGKVGKGTPERAQRAQRAARIRWGLPLTIVLPMKTVVKLDHAAIGVALRAKRIKAGKSLREIAEVIRVSISYASELELGQRNWTRERAKQYLQAIKKPKTKV